MSNSQDPGQSFNTAYNNLNAAQRQAVDTIEGPVMVIAGPGTGKTQILTLRIANILLQTDTAPESILALTFTESGAKAMRQRLHQYIGSRAYQVPMYTFHGFAQTLIQTYPDVFPRMLGGRVATDIDKIALLTQILEDNDISLLRPMGRPDYYVKPLMGMIGKLKQEYVTPDTLAEKITAQEEQLAATEKVHEKGPHKGKVRGEYKELEKVIAKNRELLYVYQRYEAALRTERLYDFDDMISEVVTALVSNEDFLRSVQEQYQYVLADEHQDVNGSQNKILETICNFHDRPNIFVVGDEKQAIYRFQGASLENFLYFEDLFNDTTTIALTENYRSGQPVLDAAHSLVAVEEGPLQDLRVPLTAAAVSTAVVERRDFSHQVVEDEWMREEIQSAIADGVLPQEIAVIVRTNREVAHIAGMLRHAGISVAASADGDILEHPITETVRSLITFVLSDGDESALFAVLHGPYWGLSVNDTMKIMQARTYQRSLLSILADPVLLEELGVESLAAAQQVVEVLATARDMDVSTAPHRTLQYLLEASGFLDHVMTHDPLEGARVVRRLYDEIEALVVRHEVSTLSDVARELQLRQQYGIGLNAPYVTTNDESVQVMTAHKSKGLEFQVVFLPHLHDKAWGGNKRAELFKVPLTRGATPSELTALDDERRLLYVAMTRAKERLCLSTAGTNSEGKELIPSRLFDDIDPATLTVQDTDGIEASFDVGATLQATASPALLQTDVVATTLRERGFSATSLNNYVRNPWDYLYRNVLRIPEVQPTHMQFGTAMHNTLQRITKYHTDQQAVPADSDIKNWLEIELGRLPVNTEEYTRLHEKGLKTLVQYVPHLTTTLPARTLEEKRIRVELPTGLTAVPTLPLTGSLDRIDIGEDGHALRVIDYKTGSPKSRNAIEGKTASSDGGYKRQLVFYALLLSLYDDASLRCNEGVLSFVEAAPNGEIKEEAFTITEAEIEELKSLICRSVEELVGGSWLTDEALIAESEYARLAQQLQRR